MSQQSSTLEIPSSTIGADWRDASSYPPPDAGGSVFAWQFLRRNEQYAPDFASLVDLADRGGTDTELTELHAELARRWGVVAMVDPSRAAPPRWRYTASPPTPDNDDALVDRFIEITFDAAAPLRPQLAAAKTALTDYTLAWLKRHPDDAPATRRVGGERNSVVFRECLQVFDATRLGVPKREIQGALWPYLGPDDQRERLRHRLGRAIELVEGGYHALVAAASLVHSYADVATDGWEITRSLISPSALLADRIR